jgi:hypothetical protein
MYATVRISMLEEKEGVMTIPVSSNLSVLNFGQKERGLVPALCLIPSFGNSTMLYKEEDFGTRVK